MEGRVNKAGERAGRQAAGARARGAQAGGARHAKGWRRTDDTSSAVAKGEENLALARTSTSLGGGGCGRAGGCSARVRCVWGCAVRRATRSTHPPTHAPTHARMHTRHPPAREVGGVCVELHHCIAQGARGQPREQPHRPVTRACGGGGRAGRWAGCEARGGGGATSPRAGLTHARSPDTLPPPPPPTHTHTQPAPPPGSGSPRALLCRVDHPHACAHTHTAPPPPPTPPQPPTHHEPCSAGSTTHW